MIGAVFAMNRVPPQPCEQRGVVVAVVLYLLAGTITAQTRWPGLEQVQRVVS